MSLISSINLSNLPELFGKKTETPKEFLTNKLGGLDKAGGASVFASPASSGAGSASFSNLLEGAVRDVDATMRNAETEQKKVLTGESTNLHQSMIAMQEASTAFSLMVEVRNKLVESYQELMRMQI